MTKIQLYYRVLLVLLIREFKIIFRTSSKFVNQDTLTYITGWVMKHFQFSVMGHGILLRSLGWATKLSAEMSYSPPAHLNLQLLYDRSLKANYLVI